ncbi:MAG: hypothetical protein ACH36H_11755 [Candidatus Nanopelagicales bacterium]
MDRRRLIRGLTTERLWAVVLVEQSLDDLLSGVRPTGTFLAAPDRNTFRADPFPVRDAAGDLWVFVEEYRRWRGLGSIVALRIGEGAVVERREVLTGPHHYSFPQAQLVEGRWVGTVETCDPLAPTYTFTAPGEPWIASLRTIPAGVIDPALAIPAPEPGRNYDQADEGGDGSPWFVVGTSGSDAFGGYRQWSAPDGVGWDEQVQFRYRDAVLARSAGNADLLRGLRSVQDCSTNYGVASAITKWDPLMHGPGEVLARFDGGSFGAGAIGSHTLSWTPDGQTVVADVWKRGKRALSAVHRAIEQRHGSVCAGRRASARMS